MARQKYRYWRCATRWTATDRSRPKLRVLTGGVRTSPPALDRTAFEEVRIDTDRWIDEGGTLNAAAEQSSPHRVR